MSGKDRSALDERQLSRLLEVGRELAGELDLERVMGRALDVARELTGAEYAALGVLDERRQELERFLTRGLDERTVAEIGDHPRGHGVLGLLIREPRSLRLDDVSSHPESVGMPPGHPPMHSFLGVPLVVRGRGWGNLYLSEKGDGPFTEADQQAAETLAGWVGTAIGNAQLYHGVEQQRDDLRRANRALEAASEIARAVGGETELTPILTTIVGRGRLLVEAESLALLLADEGGRRLSLAASSEPGAAAVSVSVSGSIAGQVYRHRRPLRAEHLDPGRLTHSDDPDHPGAMLVPLLYRGACLGVLVAIESRQGRALTPGRDEEPVLLSIAASAATAVGTARSVAESRVRHSLEAAERERARWARELHDDTLQNLAGLRMSISSARRNASSPEVAETLGESLERVDGMIAELRRLIADLRPASLDELGIGPALSALVERVAGDSDLKIELSLDLGPVTPPARLPAEFEITIYRFVQEALANVVAHAEADTATIELAIDEDTVGVRVSDDGRGFDPGGLWRRAAGVGVPGDANHGFGLPGMRERVTLLRGWLDIDSAPGHGTRLSAILPRVPDLAWVG